MSTQHLHRRPVSEEYPLPIQYMGKVAYVTMANGGILIVDAVNAAKVATYQWVTKNVRGRISQVCCNKNLKFITLSRFLTQCKEDERVYVNNGNLLDNRMENFTTVKWGGAHKRWKGGNLIKKEVPVEVDNAAYKGVRYVGGSRNPYQAFIEDAGKTRIIGNYLSSEAAAAARDCAALELFGEDYRGTNL